MKKKVQRILVIILFLILTLSLGYVCYGKMNRKRKVLFSWKSTAITEEKERLFLCMETLGADILYQGFSDKIDLQEVQSFLLEANERGIEVYFLTGEAEWAKPKMEEKIYQKMDKIQEYNALVPSKAAIRGIVCDIEPYTLSKWEKNSQELMNSYVSVMKEAYQSAKSRGLSMVAVIPYFYDTEGFENGLTELITNGCDQVAVMNYYRDKEIEHIKMEAQIAAEAKKQLITIYEFNPSGKHGLTDKNTYHDLGISEALNNFSNLYKEYKKQQVIMGFHDYESIKEVLENE